MYEKLEQSAKYIQSLRSTSPKIGVVLGSGLGAFVDKIENPKVVPYSEIPHFKNPNVEGHEGRLILGSVEGIEIAVLQGRIHAYEGHSMEEVVFSTRVLATLGIENLILTNAAGGINLDYNPGDIILIDDHINLTGKNPLIGPNKSELGPRFPDMSNAYHPDIKKAFIESAKDMNSDLKSGVYAGLLGPTYETPSEIKMLRILGADMVGMSTVPETIAANHFGVKVGGLSCITNMAAGIKDETLKHEDIKEQALKVMSFFSTLLANAIKKIGNEE
ncbi:MAG: purine-nucleoside phosphorylase [Halobacteriovoraceae bacterium]|nr:purine-nucleoside phosphorylase [Halobacteriovoraceae bacterium]|tara:strand:- start:35 stop:859 length:825 start_codon:yes stop_codon:yes gene_type:complete